MKKIKIRSVIEPIGLILLISIAWREQTVLKDAWDVILKSNLKLYFLALSIFWFTYIWSAIGYKILAKKTKISDIVSINIAASGPGKIIPGGAGFLTFGILYLRKKGYSTEEAASIATTNNLIGFLVNSLVLVIIASTDKTLFTNINAKDALIPFTLVSAITVAIFWIVFAHPKTKKSAVKAINTFKKTLLDLLASPKNFILLSLSNFGVLLTNATVLFVSARAVGMTLHITQAVVGMSFGVAAGSLLPTPGGVGGVEAGLIATLVLMGFDTSAATASALLFRSATYIQPFIPGCIAYLIMRRKKLL